MELLPNGLTLELAEGTFPLSTDSMVLSDYVRLSRNARVLDLGSGCGTLGLLLCARNPFCNVTGVELTQEAHLAAEENIRRNGLQDRMESICADLCTVPDFICPGSYGCCVSNPPYFSGGPASASLPAARREDCCAPEQLFRSAAWALKFGGDFFLVHRPERLGQLIALGAANGLEAKGLRLLRHRTDSDVNLIFLHFRKGAKPGLKLEEMALYDPDGSPTEHYRRIYHHKEA